MSKSDELPNELRDYLSTIYLDEPEEIRLSMLDRNNWKLNYCQVCNQMTNHSNNNCLKCIKRKEKMTKINQTIQGDLETHIFKCYCGEHSYLEIMVDDDDQQLYLTITQSPTKLLERIKLALRALRGLEFYSSNELVIDSTDVKELSKIFNNIKKGLK